MGPDLNEQLSINENAFIGKAKNEKLHKKKINFNLFLLYQKNNKKDFSWTFLEQYVNNNFIRLVYYSFKCKTVNYYILF